MNPAAPVSIAIVDDHELFRKALKYVLGQWGYEVKLQASNGKRLIEQLDENDLPDICIMDVIMPEMNGYETIKQLKAKWPGIKVIIYSMRIDAGIKRIPLLGSDSSVSKQADISELQYTLQQLIQGMSKGTC